MITYSTAGKRTSRRKVVVIGAGFAGMAVVRALQGSDAEITLVDRNNHDLFQPFLFQVATSILEPAEIATPIRSLLKEMPNVRVEMREVALKHQTRARNRPEWRSTFGKVYSNRSAIDNFTSRC